MPHRVTLLNFVCWEKKQERAEVHDSPIPKCTLTLTPRGVFDLGAAD